ncbi:membrane protein insertion efficiency factor YidD [Pseudactinotalea suaedae]|uniref:membrane protein insertion efficiency factor YidD n=1 Tax=Pseudactinotalea suaedae TaxID=1524924 RepID=UPI0012E26D7E|nr:membrane protein insertion efficiency factor YidD [Pseudactinotalea suaedae]
MTEEVKPSVPARLLAGAVRGYQLIVSPWFAPRCRYYPSCSAYAIGALRTHGAIRGTGLAVWRVLRCNPWSHGGVDHVPPRRGESASQPQQHTHENRATAKGRTLGSRTSRQAQA